MKKQSDEITAFHSENLEEILSKVKFKTEYPFSDEMLKLCKETNSFRQEYYYIERGSDYAFFIVYYNRLNVFTLGKKELFMNVKTIGYPCSLSECGFITNNQKFMLEYIRKIKGAKLVLNVQNPVPLKNSVLGETLPTCVLDVDYQTADEYLSKLRSSYRRRINIAKKKSEGVCVKKVTSLSDEEYRMYLNTYEKSDFKLEKMEKEFFDRVDGVKLVFYSDNDPLGFVLLKEEKEKLTFMLCGMNYDRPTADLYYYMLFNIVEYAIDNNFKKIDFGQTSEQTKMKFGALLEKRYFYALHSNFFWSIFAKATKPLLEYRYSFPNYRVLKE